MGSTKNNFFPQFYRNPGDIRHLGYEQELPHMVHRHHIIKKIREIGQKQQNENSRISGGTKHTVGSSTESSVTDHVLALSGNTKTIVRVLPGPKPLFTSHQLCDVRNELGN